jgi:hypothetical protein
VATYPRANYHYILLTCGGAAYRSQLKFKNRNREIPIYDFLNFTKSHLQIIFLFLRFQLCAALK